VTIQTKSVRDGTIIETYEKESKLVRYWHIENFKNTKIHIVK